MLCSSFTCSCCWLSVSLYQDGSCARTRIRTSSFHWFIPCAMNTAWLRTGTQQIFVQGMNHWLWGGDQFRWLIIFSAPKRKHWQPEINLGNCQEEAASVKPRMFWLPCLWPAVRGSQGMWLSVAPCMKGLHVPDKGVSCAVALAIMSTRTIFT